jgi:hypothetical protein
LTASNHGVLSLIFSFLHEPKKDRTEVNYGKIHDRRPSHHQAIAARKLGLGMVQVIRLAIRRWAQLESIHPEQG